MNEKKDNKALKALTIVLALSLIVLAVFTVNFYNEEQASKVILQDEKVALENNLQELLKNYNDAIAENSEYSAELRFAKERIESLLDSVKDMNANLALISRYRKEISALQKEKNQLFRMVDSLNLSNKMLAIKVDSTQIELDRRSLMADSLAVQTKKLASKVEIGSKIHISNFKAEAVKVKNNGKVISTQRSRRANNIKACFTVAKNSLADSGEKEFYVQVIDPKNNLIGDPNSITYDDAVLNYSAVSKVYYENEDLNVCVMIEEEDLEDGIYTANIFYGPELLGTQTFKLK